MVLIWNDRSSMVDGLSQVLKGQARAGGGKEVRASVKLTGAIIASRGRERRKQVLLIVALTGGRPWKEEFARPTWA
jgi:hypothetical protein